MADLVQRAHNALNKNRRDALDLVSGLGVVRTRKLLETAARDLQKRINARVRAKTGETFTIAQLRTTLVQVRETIRELNGGLQENILDAGHQAAENAVEHTVEYLRRADAAFRGVGEQPLALREAAMFEESIQGARSSILHRLASSGEPVENADEEPHPARIGILQRYGEQTVHHFERTLQRGLIARKTWGQMAEDITEDSPFLKQAPAFWAARIVRTEVMGAYNRSSWESIREADQQLEDMTKILSATFDERTAADSYAVHGQIRHPEEAFESWFGLYQHPPNRPNDREIVVPHRMSWPIPKYLAWRSGTDILKAWKRDGNKGTPPERPLMTTIPLNQFGAKQEPQLSR